VAQNRGGKNSLRHIRGEIEALRRSVDSLKKEYTSQNDQANAAENNTVVAPAVAPKPPSEGNSVTTEPEAEASRSKKKESRENWKFGMEIVASVFLMLAAIFTGFQWKAASQANALTQKALRNARDNFRQDQRPYIWLTNELGSPRFVPFNNDPASGTGQAVWAYHFTNYGKTPASNIRFTEEIKVGDRPFAKTHAHDNRTRESVGAPLPPNKTDFSMVISEPGITRAEFSLLMSVQSQKTISIRVVFRYTDNSIGQYETGICLQRLNAGAIGYCRDGNYIK
jgi:hypothetical protein